MSLDRQPFDEEESVDFEATAGTSRALIDMGELAISRLRGGHLYQEIYPGQRGQACKVNPFLVVPSSKPDNMHVTREDTYRDSSQLEPGPSTSWQSQARCLLIRLVPMLARRLEVRT